MTRLSKRLLFTSVGVLFMGLALLWLTASGGGSYRAEAIVILKPYTNAVFARSFEQRIVQKIPAVIRLRVSPSYSAPQTPTTPAVTNGAGIHIIVVGATSQEAQRLANEAAVSLCATAKELYGGTAEVIDRADRARPYSFFHDSLQPGVARFFKQK